MNSNLDNLLYRVISGECIVTFNKKDYVLKQPSFKLKYEALLFYNKAIYQNRFKPWLNINQCYTKLITSGLLSFNFIDDIKKLEQQLDNTKVELYKSYLDTKRQKQLRNIIRSLRIQIAKLEDTKNSLRPFTVVGFASILKYEYILRRTLYNSENELAFFHDNINYDLLTKALSSNITHQEYRALARSNVWRTYYKTMLNPFPDFQYFTDEQQELLSYSQMYDSIYKSTECPADHIIEDDDMLDGWMILQRREADQQKKESLGDKIAQKHSNAQNVFVVAKSDEERKLIDDLNSPRSRMVRQQRELQVKQQKEVKGGELIDEKIEKFNQSRKTFLDSVKRK